MFWIALSAIVNSILALATVVIIIMNYRQVKASNRQADASQDQVFEMRKQVEASQQQLRASRDQLQITREQFKEQLRISEEQLEQSKKQVQGALEAAQRPFLFPASPLALQLGSDGDYFDFDHRDPNQEEALEDEFCLTLRNVGAGVALNIRAIIAEQHEKTPEMLNLPPGTFLAPGISTMRLPRVRSVILDTALPPGNDAKEPHRGGPFIIGWDTTIDGDSRNTLAAPPSPTNEHPFHIVARLTVFQEDIFSHTYACQFEFTDQWRWVFHWSGKVPPDSEALKCLKLKP